eukprot:scaffold77928_cov33-Prasinocladus_malaysianus.AAC.3
MAIYEYAKSGALYSGRYIRGAIFGGAISGGAKSGGAIFSCADFGSYYENKRKMNLESDDKTKARSTL